MTAKDHNKLLGIFFTIHGGMQLIGGVLAALIYGGMGAFVLSTSRRSEEQMVGGIFLLIAILVGLLILVFAGFYLLTGFKLMKEQRIGRILGIIASCLALLGFPLGTALGIYGLWFFFGELGNNFYSDAYGASAYPPPPPNSWQ